jgi:type I restriction enzyme S subunit
MMAEKPLALAGLTPEAKRLLENFEVLVGAPGGMQRLRELILRMAVRGKLVPQLPIEGDVSTLLPQIDAERSRIAKSTRTSSVPIAGPYDLPSAWAWLPLERVFGLLSTSGKKVLSSEVVASGRFPVVDQGQLFVRGYTNNEESVIRIPGPVVIFGDHTRELKYIDFDFVAGADGTKVLRPTGVNERYFYWCLRNFRLESRGYARHYQLLLEQAFPLAPFAEQGRIAAKVDELMRHCDDLEARQAKQRATAGRLNKAVLGALTSAEGPAELAASWERVAENFEELVGRPEDVAEIRETILNLAIRGRLLEERATDEQAASLLDRIAVERERLVRAGDMRRSEKSADVGPDEQAFSLPRSWCWTRLGALCFKVADGPHFSPVYVPSEDGVMFLSGRNIRVGGFDLQDVKYVSRADHLSFCERVRPEHGDILYTKGGTTGVALVNDLDVEFSVWVHVAVLKIAKRWLFPRYVSLVLNSPHCYAQAQKLTHGIGNKDLGLTRMILITLPLPPLAEQHRIVAKVDRLMALCDDLEAKLRRTDETARKLADALVAELLA